MPRTIGSPIYSVPKEFVEEVDLSRTQSISSCADCADCVDVHPLTDGENVLLVSGEERMVMTIADFNGLKEISL
jgi:hypothetical protein